MCRSELRKDLIAVDKVDADVFFQALKTEINNSDNMRVLNEKEYPSYVNDREMRVTVEATEKLKESYDALGVKVCYSMAIPLEDLDHETPLSLAFFWPRHIADSILSRLVSRIDKKGLHAGV